MSAGAVKALIVIGIWASMGASRLAEPTTTIMGVVRDPTAKLGIAGATITSDGTSYAARTDENGRFVVRSLRTSTVLKVSKVGFLEVQYPFLSLSVDTVFTEVELRSDPPGEVSYAPTGFLKFLCIVDTDPHQLLILNTCAGMTLDRFDTRIIKHNPWSPYFGPAGDRGGVLLVTRRDPKPK